ncbi:MAG: hypothetical protein JW737_06610 [Acidobacteria bacterium]|nr:hypothetical protein [Acidobacteriota bacterium]
MVCEHLRALEKDLIKAGIKETARGQVWTENCREWVYFDVVLDLESLSARFQFDKHITVHENLDPKSGTERGFYCTKCHDGIMGLIKGSKKYL